MPYTYNYPRPAVTTDCIVVYQDQHSSELLLIQRKKDPFQNMWALPGGFVEIDEPLEAAAKRELKEETNLDQIEIVQFKTYGDPHRDPRGRTISVVFYGLIHEKSPKIQAGDDAGDVGWFPLNKLPALAFDHAAIIQEAKETILAKVSE